MKYMCKLDHGNVDWRMIEAPDMIQAAEIFAEKDDYEIRAKAKDVCGAESDWGSLTIQMSRKHKFNKFMHWYIYIIIYMFK